MTDQTTTRRLVVLGVREYPADDDNYPTGFDAQLDELREWWCNPALGQLAFTPITPKITTKPELMKFVEDEHLACAGPDDILMVYVTGHGLRGRSGRHYLCMPDGDDNHPTRTHVNTGELVELLLTSDAEHLLVLVNSCFGNAITEDVRRAVKDVARSRRQLDTVGVITIGDFDDRPRMLELKELLAAAHQRLTTVAGITTQHLTVDQFVSELAHAAREHHLDLLEPTKVHPQRYTLTESLALPNPGYRPPDDLVEPQRREVAANSSELDYWLDRASGRTSSDDPGWYFAGRHTLTEQVADFFRDTTGSLIVTGVAGSGKSALLARAVTLTDSKFLADARFTAAVDAIRRTAPETIPPPGSVHAAVLARNQNATNILRSIAGALDTEPSAVLPGPEENERLRQLIAAVAGTRPVTVVLDGLDEATNPTHLMWEVLGPLARLTNKKGAPLVRFAVGLRSPGSSTGPGTLLGAAESVLPDAHVVRTDESPEADIACYVAAVLDHPDGPYWDRAADRAEVAEVVAQHVSPSFLDARFAARALRGRSYIQDLTDPGWLTTLAAGTVGLLKEDLRSLADGNSDHVLAVLRASAFAYGRGVPWAEVWPAVAEAVFEGTIPDVDRVIAFVLEGRLAGYLTQDVEDERRVYRPVHEQLAADLRSNKVVLS
jgi:AAA domain